MIITKGSQLEYTTLDVFTETRFLGNPLAIVHVPAGRPVLPTQQQLIAREFNFSETVFLHEPLPDAAWVFRVDIFMTDKELPFAGHPCVGSAWFLLDKYPEQDTVTLRVKAGDIVVLRSPEAGAGGVRLQIPVDFKRHAPYLHPTLKSTGLPALASADYVNGDGPEPVASVVKGMSFILLQLSSIDALGRCQLMPESARVPNTHLGEWAGFSSLYSFVDLGKGKLRARLIEGTLEDPATGSAASTLCGYLAQNKGKGEWKFDITQGVEMGRKSEITVFVEVGDSGEVKRIELAGSAIKVMEGAIQL